MTWTLVVNNAQMGTIHIFERSSFQTIFLTLENIYIKKIIKEKCP